MNKSNIIDHLADDVLKLGHCPICKSALAKQQNPKAPRTQCGGKENCFAIWLGYSAQAHVYFNKHNYNWSCECFSMKSDQPNMVVVNLTARDEDGNIVNIGNASSFCGFFIDLPTPKSILDYHLACEQAVESLIFL
jgi:hypothetical protein